MSWFEPAVPGALFLLLLLGLPILVFGLVKLLILPLAVWFEVRASRRRRRGVPTLLDEWPSVSIIVPAYNEARVIEDCVRSIQLTRYDRYDVILVDDGSTDNTAGLMQRLAAADPRITVLTQANAGKGAALNLGIRNATGDVLMFADADGIFSARTVLRMLRGFEDKRTGAVCGDDRAVNLNRVQTRVPAFTSHIEIGMVRRALALIGGLPVVSGHIGAFRRAVIEDIGPLREDMVGEDLELTWRVHKAGYRVVFAPRALVYAESPLTIGALWRHRVRRARGLLQTMGAHTGMIGNPRHGRFGTYLLFTAVTMVVFPVAQLLALPYLAFLLALGRSPLEAEVWGFLGWTGLFVTVVLSVFALGMNRARNYLRHVWALPLIPCYPVFTGLTMVAALAQELRGKEALWNKLARNGAVSVEGLARLQRPLDTGTGDGRLK